MRIVPNNDDETREMRPEAAAPMSESHILAGAPQYHTARLEPPRYPQPLPPEIKQQPVGGLAWPEALVFCVLMVCITVIVLQVL